MAKSHSKIFFFVLQPFPVFQIIIDIKEKRLLEAVRVNNIDRVRQLLDEGVSPNASDRFKRSALHIATSQNYIDIVRLLLEYHANPNQLDSIGNTPLHLASCTRHLEVVTLLIKHGASTLVTDGKGLHPLAIAYSKLKHWEKYKPLCITNGDLRSYHETIVNVYNVILHHFDIQKSEAEYNDFKNMEEKFKGLNTKEEMDNEVMSLLESLEKFSFSASTSCKS